MPYSLHTLDQDMLKSELTTLIEAERDFTKPRHVTLTRMINELSVTGFPLLMETARALLNEDRPKPHTWISTPLRSALERVCSVVERAPPELEQRFNPLEEEHLLNQLRALLIDLESLLMLSDEDAVSSLRTILWIGATRHLLTRMDEERDKRLRLILIYASDELGNLALTPERFERDAGDVLMEHLQLCRAGGGTLSLTLPGESDEPQIIQLRESRLALDLRGVERLKLEGYGVLDWLDGVERGLDEVKSIEVLMLSDEDVAGLKLRGIFDRVEAGWSAPVATEEIAGVEFAMVRCPAGEFWMGTDDGGSWPLDQSPRHRVKITKPFLVGQTQVTQKLWEAVMGSNPSYFRSDFRQQFFLWQDDLPVESVSWYDCVRFCNKLSELAGLELAYEINSGDELDVSLDLTRTGYRLPTEAEWEYMAKAGTEYIYAGSDDRNRVAWYDGPHHNECSTFPVAYKYDNSWSIYDCSGNVKEWCSDESSVYKYRSGLTRDPYEDCPRASKRVNRGGSWDCDAFLCRVSSRSAWSSDSPNYIRGLRLSRSLG